MKRVNFWKTLFLSALTVAAFTGCSNDDSDDDGGYPSITVNGAQSTNVAVKLEGGTTEAVTIESSGDWTLTIAGEEGADVADCVASLSSGKKGTSTVTFTVDPAETPRTYTATVTTVGSVFGQTMPLSVTIKIMQNEDASTEAKTNVAEIRALLKAMNPTKDKVAVTDEIAAKSITGIVVSNFEGHNFGNDYNIAVQDASGAKDSGLTLNANQFPDLKLSAGAVVTIPLTAAQVNTYGGVIQLAIDKSVTIATSTTEVPEPIVVTVDQLLDYESMLVKIENCMPATGASGKAWYNSTNEGNADFVTSDGKSFVVRTGSKAAFKDELIPDKFGYLIGIAGQFNGDLQLSPRTADDLAGLNQDAPAPEYQEVTIDKLGEGNYKIKDATIVGVHQKGVMFAQEVSGTVYYVLGFNNEWTTQTSNPYIESVGKLADVQGACQDRYGLYQFSTFEATAGNDSSLQLPTPETFDAAAIDAYTQAPVYKYVKLSGVLNIVEGSSYNTYTISVTGASDKNITFAYGLDAMFSGLVDGDVIDATGFALGYDSSQSKLNIMLEKATKNTSTPVITITTTPSTFAADGGKQDIAFTVANQGSYKVYAKVEGEGFSVSPGEVTSPVTVTAAANEGAAREATLTIYVAAEENGEAVAQAMVTLKQSAKPTGDEGAAYKWTFEKGTFSSDGGTITAGDPAMSWTYPAVYINWDSNPSAKGVQFGSGSSPAKLFTLTTSEYNGSVAKIVVNASNGSGGDGKLTVKVAGNQIGETISLTTTATDYTFTPSSAVSGEITIELTNTVKAMYIKSIAINSEE